MKNCKQRVYITCIYADEKFYISFEEWPWSKYPVYVRGGAVLMPNKIMQPLLAASQSIPFFPFEDTYIGLCAIKAEINVRIFNR